MKAECLWLTLELHKCKNLLLGTKFSLFLPEQMEQLWLCAESLRCEVFCWATRAQIITILLFDWNSTSDSNVTTSVFSSTFLTEELQLSVFVCVKGQRGTCVRGCRGGGSGTGWVAEEIKLVDLLLHGGIKPMLWALFWKTLKAAASLIIKSSPFALICSCTLLWWLTLPFYLWAVPLKTL